MTADNNKLAELLFPHIHDIPNDIEKRYPVRALPDTACVTRFAPSPTGFMHLGNLYSALVNERIAHTTDGIFYLRIEDTDKKREVEGGREYIISCLANYNVLFDEGFLLEKEIGSYGPYIQSKRVDIYQIYAKYLVSQGFAYPCFCTEEELDYIRQEQEKQGTKFLGYFGKWAKHRNFSLVQVKDELNKKRRFTLRFKAEPIGSINKWMDDIRGEISITENEHDFVLLKSDGVPTYHFAHVIDDHLMGTTHVIRGEEWLPSLPIHLQLFQAFDWKIPHYAHISPIMKIDIETHHKRKLSKRKDREAAVMFFEEQGYPNIAVIEYLMSVMNSDFDEWRLRNQNSTYDDFPFNIKNMCVSGAIFDIKKLKAVSRNVISKLDANSVYQEVTHWAKTYDYDFYKILTGDEDYSKRILDIAYKNAEKPRKDFALWSEVKSTYSYFFDELFNITLCYPEKINRKVAADILRKYCDIFSTEDDATVWFEKMKHFVQATGFALTKVEYDQSPDIFLGTIADAISLLRYATTGQYTSPDMFYVLNTLGEHRVKRRCSYLAEFLENFCSLTFGCIN